MKCTTIDSPPVLVSWDLNLVSRLSSLDKPVHMNLSQNCNLYDIHSVCHFLLKTLLHSVPHPRKFVINQDAQVILSEEQDGAFAYVST